MNVENKECNFLMGFNNEFAGCSKKRMIDSTCEKNTNVPVSFSSLGVYTSSISSSINTINMKIKNIEDKSNVKAIYACEVGSKNWKSDSPNSDYDVRFIYISPKSKYLDKNHKDTIKVEFNEDFDIYGYDLFKILKEVKTQEYTPFEWVNSGIQYQKSPFFEELKKLVLENTDVENISKSYKRLTIGNFKDLLQDKQKVNIKHYLLLLKTIMMADYADKNGQLPPLTYPELFDAQQDSYKEVCEMGRNLLKIKKESSKDVTVPRIPALDKFIESKVKEYSSQDLTKQPLNEEACSKLDAFFEKTINSLEFAEINKVKPTQIDLKRFEMFPSDNDYRKMLVTTIGLPEEDYIALKSIVGPQEFKALIEDFNNKPDVYSTGAEINPKTGKAILYNVQNGTFRANLHMHTQNSDGKLTVQQLLDSAAKYADKVAKINKNSTDVLEPFTIAITDHNTVEGCKEAIDIIRQNPQKYENLRVVLGAELTAKETNAGDYTPSKPYEIHILAQCLNPFDEKLNMELKNRIDEANPCYSSMGTIAETVEMLSEQPDVLCGYAHPIEHQSYKKAPAKNKLFEVINNLISRFKNVGKNRTLFVENYYQSYKTPLSNDSELLSQIKNHTEALGLINTGGLDTHGDSIFFD